MKKVIFIAFFAIAAFALASFTTSHFMASKVNVPPTQNYSYNVNMPIDGALYNPCSGELIDYTGSLHFNSHGQIKNGVVKEDLKINTQGVSGVGETSGLKYQIMEQDHQQSTTADGCLTTTTVTTHFKVVSQGSSENFTLTQKAVYTYNYCTNEFNIISEEFSSECK